MPELSNKKPAGEFGEGEMAPTIVKPGRRLRSASTASGTERLNINLHATTAKALQELSDAKGVTQTETVRRAIALLKLLEEQSSRGIEIHLVDPSDMSKVRVLELL